MGSGLSRLETRWWEAEAQRKVTTTKNTRKVVVICSLIPGVDETAMVAGLKERSDLDTLFELHCRYQNLPTEQRANFTDLTVDFKAKEFWRALQMPLGSAESPWDPNWQPPFGGSSSGIAAEFHASVCRAIFRVPFLDFVKYALGYNTKAHLLMSLLHAVCDVRDGLRTAFQDRPMTRDVYIEVEKALTPQHHPLAHWIIASSLHHTTYAPYDALASNLAIIRTMFEKHNINLVLKRLAALYQRFSHVSQKYDWQKWSADLDFWECVNQTLWSGKYATPFMPPHLSTEDLHERLRFLEGFPTAAEARERSPWGTAMSSMKRLIQIPQSDSGGRVSQYSIRQGLVMTGDVSQASLRHPATGPRI